MLSAVSMAAAPASEADSCRWLWQPWLLGWGLRPQTKGGVGCDVHPPLPPPGRAGAARSWGTGYKFRVSWCANGFHAQSE